MPSPSKLSDAATIARAVLGYGSPSSYSGVRGRRKMVPTAEFDAATGDVLARGRRWEVLPESQEEIDRAAAYGREVMGRDDVVGAYRSGVGAAYPKGDRDTRRHELFHGMVDSEYAQRYYGGRPITPSVPSVAALAAARRLAGKNMFLLGASDLAEELTAQSVGRGRPLTFQEASDIAGIYGDKRSGAEAVPFRVVEYGLTPFADPQSTAAAMLASIAAGNAISHAIHGMPAEQEQLPVSGMTTDELISLLGQQ